MRTIAFLSALLAILAITSSAQLVPKGNVFIGYSYIHQGAKSTDASNLNGWNGSLEGRVLPFIGLVVDTSGYYGKGSVLPCPIVPVGGGSLPCPPSARLYNVLLGPRVSFSVHGIRPFAHALLGVAHQSENPAGSTITDNSFATAIGGGADFKLAPIIGWRVQADALRTSLFGSSEVNLRFSTGLVLRF